MEIDIPFDFVILNYRYFIGVVLSIVISLWLGYWFFFREGITRERATLSFWLGTPLILSSLVYIVTMLRISEIKRIPITAESEKFNREYWIANPDDRFGMALGLELKGKTLKEVWSLLDDWPYDTSMIYLEDRPPHFILSFLVDRRGFLTDKSASLQVFLDSNHVVDTVGIIWIVL